MDEKQNNKIATPSEEIHPEDIAEGDDEMGLSLAQKTQLKILFNQMNGLNVDVFKDIDLGDHQDKLTLHSKSIKNDIQRNLLVRHHGNLNVMIQFKAVRKIEYILCLLKRVEVAKKLFVLEIESGTEVFIPSDLRIDHLPLSFQFNDPVMMIIQQRMSDDRKEYFIKKN